MRILSLSARFLLGIGLAASGASAQVGDIMGPDPGVQQMRGPLHFCGRFVAIDVAADEQVGWQRGPDFDLYFLQSSQGGFGLYEGNHPEQGGTAEPTIVSGLPARRRREADGGYSYLIQIPGVPFPTFAHLYGDAWKGDERDLPLLARVTIGQPAAIGCERPSFQR
jgi:hypothetical protein